VLEPGSRYESARTGGTFEIKENSPQRIRFERLLMPDTGKADPHLHLDLTQTFEALEGRGMIEVERETRELVAGDQVSLSPGTPHRDPWNPGDDQFRVRATIEPCPEFIRAYGEALAHHLSEGTVNSQDEMPLLQVLLLAKEFDGRSYRAGVPIAFQRATLPIIAALARLRGYRARYDDPA
jgi:mannose-6-phosphate isomerase-like protein (cupin superfamily)